jgi:hypothetical protein
MGMYWIRQGWEMKDATREVTDVIGAKQVNANDSVFAMAA